MNFQTGSEYPIVKSQITSDVFGLRISKPLDNPIWDLDNLQITPDVFGLTIYKPLDHQIWDLDNLRT